MGVTLGSTRRVAIQPPENPCTRYAETYGRLRSEVTSERVSRATNGA